MNSQLIYLKHSILVACLAVLISGSAQAKQATGFAPLPYTVPEGSLDFTAIKGAKALWGISERGAGYRIEVPKNWNGDLMVFLRGNGILCDAISKIGCELQIDSNPLRHHAISRGYAWATTTYRDFRTFPEDHADDVVELMDIFTDQIAPPSRAYVWGKSFGSATALAVTQLYPDLFAGAMPVCSGITQYSFKSFFDFNLMAMALVAPNDEVVAEYLRKFTFPLDTNYYTTNIAPRVLAGLGEGFPRNPNEVGKSFKDYVYIYSGGERPLFEASFNASAVPMIKYYLGIAHPMDPGNRIPFENRSTVYRFESASGQPLSAREKQINESMPRFACDPEICTGAAGQTTQGIKGGLFEFTGDLNVPTLHLQQVGDLTAMFSGSIEIAQRVKKNGKLGRLVQRATRGIQHCHFDTEELAQGFDDLVGWVETYRKPKGDNFLDPKQVSSVQFGCTYTDKKIRLDHQFDIVCKTTD